MHEAIKTKVMVRLHQPKKACATWSREFGYNIYKKMESNKKDSRCCTCIWNVTSRYEILGKDTKYVVDVEKETCICGSWQLTGIPYKHAICALSFKRKELDDYLYDLYKRDKVLLLYAFMMRAVPTIKFWRKRSLIPEPMPPPVKKMT